MSSPHHRRKNQDVIFDYICVVLFWQEKESWMKLCERVSDRCYVMGDAVYHRPGKLIQEELHDDFKTSGILLKLEQMNTITDVLNVAHKMEGTHSLTHQQCHLYPCIRTTHHVVPCHVILPFIPLHENHSSCRAMSRNITLYTPAWEPLIMSCHVT